MAVYISEISYSSGSPSDFVEVAAHSGADLSGYSIYKYSNSGLVLGGPVPLGVVQSTTAGTDAYVVDRDTAGFSGITKSQAVALVDDSGNVVQFISFDGNTVTATEGPANGQSSDDIGTATLGRSLQSDDSGNSYQTQDTPNRGSVPCYAPGTLIDTPGGPRQVEMLRPGDLVITQDHGPQAIRWTRSGEHPLETAAPNKRPMLIGAGSLGRNRPAQDLVVSPQHRVLAGGGGQLEELFDDEVLVPSQALTGLPSIRHMMGRKSITWIHFACARHEVVRANGCWTESLLLGHMMLNTLSAVERRALRILFPDSGASDAWNGPPVRPCLTVGETRRAIANAKVIFGKSPERVKSV